MLSLWEIDDYYVVELSLEKGQYNHHVFIWLQAWSEYWWVHERVLGDYFYPLGIYR